MQAAATANLAVIQAELASLRSDVATLRGEMRWAAGAVLSVVLAGFAILGAGQWLLYGKLVDLSAGTAVRIVEVGQPVIDGTVTP